MATDRVMEARSGRENQRYGSNGERLVAGIVPLSSDKRHVLLISSTNRQTWVLPKGGWELDEQHIQDAARREAWEEAGIAVAIGKDLGMVHDKRSDEQLTSYAPRAAYHFFEATVEKIEEEWPEMEKRTRQWMGYEQAKEALRQRPELLDALERSGITRT